MATTAITPRRSNALMLLLLLALTFILRLAQPISDFEQRQSQAYLKQIGMREWGHLPLWQPYLETGQPLPLQIDPAKVLPMLLVAVEMGVVIAAILTALLAAVGGWLLLRLLDVGDPATVAFGVVCGLTLDDHYAFIWVLVGIIGLVFGEGKLRRPLVVISLLAALLWFNANGLASLSATPLTYGTLIVLTLIIAYSASTAESRRTLIRMAAVSITVVLLAFIAAQGWIDELLLRNAPASIAQDALLPCLDKVRTMTTDSFVSVLAPDDPRLTMSYLTRRLRRESAASIERQPQYALAFSADANTRVDLQTLGYVELKRSPRLRGDDPQHCLFVDPASSGYAYALPQANAGLAIPVPLLLHALDRITLRVQGDPRQSYHLVISERAVDGWSVWIDGTASPVEPVNGFIGVTLPPASASSTASEVREISFQFRPALTVILGWGIVAFCLLSIGYLLRLDRWFPDSLRRQFVSAPDRLAVALRRWFKRLYVALMSPVNDD